MIGLQIGLWGAALRGGAWSPAALFSAGEAGGWTPDFSPAAGNLWTDTGRTTLAAAAGDTIRAVRFKTAGADIYATNATGWALAQDSGGRWYLQAGTGVFATSAIDFTGSDEMMVAAGVRKAAAAGINLIAELSPVLDSNTGGFFLAGPRISGSSNDYGWRSKGSAQAEAISAGGYAPPHTGVVVGTSKISTDSATLRVNGAQAATSAADQGTGAYGNHALYIGGRSGGTLLFTGRVYGLVVRGKLPSAAELASVEAWTNQRTGAF